MTECARRKKRALEYLNKKNDIHSRERSHEDTQSIKTSVWNRLSEKQSEVQRPKES